MNSTVESLRDYDPALLEVIARQRGAEADSGPEAIIQALSEMNASPLSVELAWEQLSPEEQRALALLAARGGWQPAVYWEEEFGAIRQFGPARLLREKLWTEPNNVTEALYFRALIFRALNPNTGSSVWYIPPELLHLLPAAGDTEAGVVGPPLPLTTDVHLAMPPSDLMARVVYHALMAARSGGDATADLARRLSEEPDSPDKHRVRTFVELGFSLGQTMGFLTDHHLAVKARPTITTWLAQPRRTALREVATAWLGSDRWHELLHAPGLVYDGGELPPASKARRLVCKALSRLTPDRWYSMADVRGWLRRTEPGFLRSDHDFSRLYMRAEAGEHLDGVGAWMEVEGRFIEEVCVALNALEVVALGAGQDGTCLRVARGPWWPAAAEDTSAEPPVRVTPDLALFLAPSAPFVERFHVESIAEPTGNVGRWQVTRASVRHAQARGIAQRTIARTLSRWNGGDHPGVEMRLAALAAPPVAQVHQVLMVEAEDDDAYRTLLRDRALGLTIQDVLPGRRVLLRADRVDAALVRLRALGFAVELPPGDAAPPEG